jgi:hypothetical protein
LSSWRASFHITCSAGVLAANFAGFSLYEPGFIFSSFIVLLFDRSLCGWPCAETWTVLLAVFCSYVSIPGLISNLHKEIKNEISSCSPCFPVTEVWKWAPNGWMLLVFLFPSHIYISYLFKLTIAGRALFSFPSLSCK